MVLTNVTYKYAKKSNTNIQRTLPVRLMLCGQLVPTKPVVQDHPTNIDASEPAMEDKCDTNNICLCISQWTTKFQ